MHVPPQVYKTIKGQILKGDTAGAEKGMQKIAERRRSGRED